jgi:protein-L-isoaspartate(D-aspartate) O-methyltransferase
MEKIDSFRHKGLRAKMVANLQTMGIHQPAVLRAMATVPRHFFLDSMFDKLAYDNTALPLPGDWRDDPQTISHPLTVACQTQLLQLKPTDKVLEIGTGCGYQAAVLCAMHVQLFSIERQQALYLFAKDILSQMNYRPTLIFGDGFEGLPQHTPFDKIIVTCGAPTLPPKLQAQLAIGGRMVIPIGTTPEHYLFAIDRISEMEFKSTNYGRCSNFVPMLQDTVRE